jgi:hypothetical protein
MKRFAILLLLLAGSFAHGQGPVPITIEGGDVQTVKVSKVVTTYIDQSLVTSFPFKLKAPEGGAAYWWTLPLGVKGTEANEVLTITAAPKGDVTIGIKILVVDFEKKKVFNETGTLTFAVGSVTPIPPDPIPVPPGPAPTPLTATFQVAYNADLDPDKAVKLAKYIDILDNAVTVAKASGKVKTAGDFTLGVHAAVESVVGPKATAIPNTRAAVSAYLQTVLPREPSTLANDAYYFRVSAEHSYVVLSLKGLVR